MGSASPSAAALSRPIWILLGLAFLLNAGSGIALWLWPTHAWRIFHGCTIPLFLITLGVIWRVHIVRAWRLRKNLLSGMLILAVFLVLTATGWGIYYSGSDEGQKQFAQWHTWLGLSSTLILFGHAILGYRSRSES